MSKFFIETLSFGVAEGGMSCGGWVPGPDILEIKVKQTDGNAFYLSQALVDGMPHFFQTKTSTFDLQITGNGDDEAWNKLNECLIVSGMDYEEAFEQSLKDACDILPLLLFLKLATKSLEFDCNKPNTIIIEQDLSSIDLLSINNSPKEN